MNHGDIREKVSRALDALGDSPEEVAATLKKAGVRGVRNNPRSCPIAIYLHREVNDGWHFGMAGVYVSCLDDEMEVVRVTPPGAVRTFAMQFDHKEHPDLEVE